VEAWKAALIASGHPCAKATGDTCQDPPCWHADAALRAIVGRVIPVAPGGPSERGGNRHRELLAYDPQGKTRIRFSLLPDQIARVVDVRTSSVSDRIAAIDDFVRAGYEVHVNFSPVILYEGWERD